MLTSFISNHPSTLHKRQLVTAAKVNGNGIDLADLVAKTVLSAAKGLANMATHKTTPKLPTYRAAITFGYMTTNTKVMTKKKRQACSC